ncbi:MAG: class I adenylate-forming enzyme family protein [Acidimicrobiia bacterium]|nr:class I adenylate-forming enzyme family protein [Acidimicrobiia bacterium]
MLDAIVRRAAERFADAPAFVAADGTALTYRDLDRRAEEVAAGLRSRFGVGPGQLVALVLPSGFDYLVLYAATARLGAATAGVNPRFTADERQRVLETARPDLVVTDDPDLDVGDVAVVRSDRAEAELAITDGIVPTLEDDPDRTVAVVFTSGTTGAPKGAVFTGRQLVAVADADWGLEHWGGGGHMLASTQFAHVGFMTKLPWYLMTGATTHLLERWRAADALRLIAEHRMSSVGGVAPQVALMLREPDFDRYDLSAVKRIIMGGGPSPPTLVEEARRRFDAAYSIRYSSTESGGIGTATAFDADDEEALSTVGRPRPGWRCGSPPTTRAVACCRRTRVGELQLRSPAVMEGYWRDPEATASTLVDGGWLRTGDLAYLDERGFVRLAGRRKEMYVRGGYNVYPMEVEAVLASHPDIEAVAVVPRPDDVMGEIGVAVVVPRGDTVPDVEDLRAFAGKRLARHKLPEAVRPVRELPLTAMQKVDRRALEAVERDER